MKYYLHVYRETKGAGQLCGYCLYCAFAFAYANSRCFHLRGSYGLFNLSLQVALQDRIGYQGGDKHLRQTLKKLGSLCILTICNISYFPFWF